MARAELIDATLGPLEAEAEKLRLLLEALPGMEEVPRSQAMQGRGAHAASYA